MLIDRRPVRWWACRHLERAFVHLGHISGSYTYGNFGQKYFENSWSDFCNRSGTYAITAWHYLGPPARYYPPFAVGTTESLPIGIIC